MIFLKVCVCVSVSVYTHTFLKVFLFRFGNKLTTYILPFVFSLSKVSWSSVYLNVKSFLLPLFRMTRIPLQTHHNLPNQFPLMACCLQFCSNNDAICPLHVGQSFCRTNSRSRAAKLKGISVCNFDVRCPSALHQGCTNFQSHQ